MTALLCPHCGGELQPPEGSHPVTGTDPAPPPDAALDVCPLCENRVKFVRDEGGSWRIYPDREPA